MIRASIVAFAVVLAPCSPAPAQNDQVLAGIRQGLPKRWRLRVHSKRVVIYRMDPVWSLYGNRINAPPSRDSAAQRRAHIKRYGKRLRARLEYRAVARWSKRKRARAERNNQRIYKHISALKTKYNLKQMRVRRGKRLRYRATTAAARASLAAYRRERASLRAKLIELPTCNTVRLSLFLVTTVGESDAFHRIHPTTAASELVRVQALLRARCHPARP